MNNEELILRYIEAAIHRLKDARAGVKSDHWEPAQAALDRAREMTTTALGLVKYN